MDIAKVDGETDYPYHNQHDHDKYIKLRNNTDVQYVIDLLDHFIGYMYGEWCMEQMNELTTITRRRN